MTIDYRQLYPKIVELANQIEQASMSRRQRREQALQVLFRYAEASEYLHERVQQAIAQEGKTLRCAKPFEQNLAATISLPRGDHCANLAAVDGSQILPDRHAEIFFGYIHLGGVTLPYKVDQLPKEVSQNEFWFSEKEDFNEALLNFRRDVLERKLLLEISLSLEPPVLALMDGPLELWMEYRASDEERQEFHRLLQSYTDTLTMFRERGISLVGYIDRPESAYVVRLLELGAANVQDWQELRRYRPFKGVIDSDLFGLLLSPGERSAIFRLQSPLLEHLPEDSAVCFFYLCVGNGVERSVARVEIPLWLARDERLVEQLQALLLNQCRQSGSYAYPYLLHRAHEVAVVRPEDRDAIVRTLLVELQRRGYPPTKLSNKQGLKNMPLRKKSHLE
ncbi:MAG: DNA double-strand break repair nuclease NurA [Anaerolineales bacterium]|nr:DNA double-strand break repair nuclease NurA [Anaerolineales bacterium]